MAITLDSRYVRSYVKLQLKNPINITRPLVVSDKFLVLILCSEVGTGVARFESGLGIPTPAGGECHEELVVP